jgi:lysophospholipase L1-like esterase
MHLPSIFQPESPRSPMHSLLRRLRPLAFAFAFSLAAALQAAPEPAQISHAGAPIRVACVGDSITQGVGTERGKSYPNQLQELLGAGWKVANFGVSGRTLLRNGDYPYWKELALRNALEFQPNVVVIMLGTNDTKPQNWKFHEEFLTDYRELVKTFRSLPSKPRVFVCRPCPVPEPGNFGINEAGVQAQIPLIDKMAREEGLGVIDMHAALSSHPEVLPDRVHPNSAGAGMMARMVAAALAGKSIFPSGLKIMPIGDSITFGFDGTNAGYRGPLYNLLAPMAPGLQFVGSSTEGKVTTMDSPLPQNQRHNEGHGSYAINDILNNLDGLDSTIFNKYGCADRDPNGGHWFDGTTYTPRRGTPPVTRGPIYPDIITLMIGTNDNGAGPTCPAYDHAAVQTRLHNLIAKITALRPACRVFIAKITPRATQSNADDYNTIVASEAASFKAAGKKVYLVDLNAGFPIATGLTKDSVHPNDTGFSWMARRWYEAIVSAYSTGLLPGETAK